MMMFAVAVQTGLITGWIHTISFARSRCAVRGLRSSIKDLSAGRTFHVNIGSAQEFHRWAKKHGFEHVVRDQSRRNERRERRFQEWNRRKPSNLITDKREYYRKVYLKSDHWKALKAAKLRQNPYCEKCGADYLIDVHHLNYRNLYDVRLCDVQSLCRGCHHKEHPEQI